MSNKNEPLVRVSKPKIYNKKSQVGDTLTWFVATMIILLILGFFVSTASTLVTYQGFSNMVKSLFSNAQVIINADWIGLKNSLALEIDDSNKAKIEDWINHDT